MNKIRQYLSTFELTRGFFIALLSALFLYMEYWGQSTPLISTFSGLITLYLLLKANSKTWFFAGFFIGLFWFWWISLSFIHYRMTWAIPFVIVAMGLLYATLFALISYTAEKIHTLLTPHSSLLTLLLKALGLLTLSYLHPFGFDWFKPELMFVNSYIGIAKWQFAIVLTAMVLSIWKKQFLFMLLILLACQLPQTPNISLPKDMEIITTHTSVQEKWNQALHAVQFNKVLKRIDQAIEQKKRLIVFPESIFPVFLNYDHKLMEALETRAKKINIVVGALYWDGKIPYNSAYIFTKEKVTVANKVLLVPFGESNPLPDFLSDWVNEVFYDGAVDYKGSEEVIDYEINGTRYRNAICFEATSEKLYEGKPERMIVLSNNGWFTPSIEPTLQRLLLQYYSKKYGTTIYHSVNMSDSYMIQSGGYFLPLGTTNP